MCRDTTNAPYWRVWACGRSHKMPLRRRISINTRRCASRCTGCGNQSDPGLKACFCLPPGILQRPQAPPRATSTCNGTGLSLPPDGLSADCHTPGVQTDVHYARYPTILSPGHGDIPLIRSASALGCKLSLKVVGSDQTSNMDVSTQLYGVQKARPHMRTRSR